MSNDSFNKNKLFNKNNFSNWIIGAIIAVIITKVFDPLGEFLFSNILNIGGSFITYISNSTYSEISNGFSELSSSRALYLIYLLFVLFLTCTYSILFQKYKSRKNKLTQLFTSIDNTTQISEKSSIVESDNLKENIETTKKQVRKLSRSNNFSFMIDTIWFLSFFLLISFFNGQSSFIRNRTIALTNNIEIVSPYITDEEYKQLKSKFHSMETQSDYKALMKELEIIADEYSLKLK